MNHNIHIHLHLNIWNHRITGWLNWGFLIQLLVKKLSVKESTNSLMNSPGKQSHSDGWRSSELGKLRNLRTLKSWRWNSFCCQWFDVQGRHVLQISTKIYIFKNQKVWCLEGGSNRLSSLSTSTQMKGNSH